MRSASIRDEGVVIRTVKLGESDRIVTLLTRHHGKIKGVAKGARKSGSKYSARLETASVVDFQWLPSSKELVRITQTDTLQSHRHLRENLDLLNATAKMLDALDSLCEDHSAHESLAELCFRALATMNETKNPNVCTVFIVKALAMEGFAPEVSNCPICTASENLNYFSLNQSAFYCENCRKDSMVKLHPHTRDSILAILEGKTTSVIENIDEIAAKEIESIATSMIEHHTGRSMRALVV